MKARWLLAALLALAGLAAAQVDCSDPNNLCTGDPCVIDAIEPADPCVVDFGARAVHIRGLRNVRNVDFTAASFLVLGQIGGGVGNGGHFSLTATTGGIVADGPFYFAGGSFTAGSGDSAVRLVAAQDIAINQPFRLIEPHFPGEGNASELRIDAGGNLAIHAGISSLEGADAFTLHAGGRIDVLGPVKNAQSGFEGNFADLLIDAGGDVLIGQPVFFVDGTITVDAGGKIDVQQSVRTRGPTIMLDAQSDITASAPVAATARAGNTLGCGGVSLVSHTGTIAASKPIFCTGSFSSSGVSITADGDVTLNGKISTRVHSSAGGPIAIGSSAGSVTFAGKVDTRGHGGLAGKLQVSGNGVQVTSARVDTRPSGRQEYTANAGDLVLDGTFMADDGGTIEGTASGNLTASGIFRVGNSGCIALTAGAMLDTSGASFDQTPGASCP